LVKNKQFTVKISLAYSREEELKPLVPLLEGKINNRGYEIEPIKIKQDEVKFNIEKYDLLYFPLPVLSTIKDVKILSNGSYSVEKLFIKKIKDEKSIKLHLNGTNSTEFYLVKMFINENVVPSLNDFNAIIDFNGGEIDLYSEWESVCGKLPIIISMIGSKKLTEDDLLKIKVIVRDSASSLVNSGEIPSISKELGLKGRESLECFFKLCKQKGLCGEVKFSLL